MRAFIFTLTLLLANAAQAGGSEYLQVLGAVASDNCSQDCARASVDNPAVGVIAGLTGRIFGVEAMATDQIVAANVSVGYQTAFARISAGFGVGLDRGVDYDWLGRRADRDRSHDTNIIFVEVARDWYFVRLMRLDSRHRFRSNPVTGYDADDNPIPGPREKVNVNVERHVLMVGARFEF